MRKNQRPASATEEKSARAFRCELAVAPTDVEPVSESGDAVVVLVAVFLALTTVVLAKLPIGSVDFPFETTFCVVD